jgi:2-polyprenyl-6-methoxyphenol hydroxylase-like FAD-dependent oxidoreductase
MGPREAHVDADYDVAIIGYGPVGQLLSLLLGERGHKTVVIERHENIYGMPRAAHFDDEIARILQAVGIRADSSAFIEPYDNWYEWRNAEGDTLLKVDWRGHGPSWWHTSNFFCQPELERALDARAGSQPAVTIRRGLSALDLSQDEHGVTISVAPAGESHRSAASETVTARYAIGCDGANSVVRERSRMPISDHGFFYDWLIVDMMPGEPMHFDPPAWQLCDPARPTTLVPGGPGRRRWEFMALPGENTEMLNSPETAWELLAPWGLTPENAAMERHTVYRFQARLAQKWRDGRALIAGDAAHLMPPFAGQGMCSGFRDANNLAWRLDLVLRGVTDDSVLDSYGPERGPHVQHFINFSMELGKVICVPDPAKARHRDLSMRASLVNPSPPPPAAPPRLGHGILRPHDSAAGLLSIQSRVKSRDDSGLFDDVAGRGWRILTTSGCRPRLDGRAADVLARLDMRILRLGEKADTDVDLIDLDGRYSGWFAQLGADTVIVRPDFYIYSVTDWNELPKTLAELDSQLPTPARPGSLNS